MPLLRPTGTSGSGVGEGPLTLQRDGMKEMLQFLQALALHSVNDLDSMSLSLLVHRTLLTLLLLRFIFKSLLLKELSMFPLFPPLTPSSTLLPLLLRAIII